MLKFERDIFVFSFNWNGMKKEINNKRIIRGWSFYDWANSVYPLVINSTIFPIYYALITKKGTNDIVHFMGMQFKNTALYTYALSISYLFICFLSPVLSALADYSGNKKSFMKFFCYLGSISCSMLYFFDAEHLWVGILFFMLATIGFSGSIVFYNAYLPEIASPDRQDSVSAQGFAMGYIGSSLLLIFNLSMVMKPSWYGIQDSGMATKLCFVLVGIWWAGFAQVTFHRLPHRQQQKNRESDFIRKGYVELKKVWKELETQGALKIFLFSFFFYSMGVQTVMNAATLFGSKELKLESQQLIVTILIIQFVAIGGAYFFSWLSRIFGNKQALVFAILIWICICFAAYFVYTANGFYLLALAVGIVMGGIQSLSRSTFSKMLPQTQDHASYFSFFDVCEKMGIVLGTASFGMIEELSGSMRNSVITLAVFFIIGLVILLFVKTKNKIIQVKKFEAS